MNPFNTTFTETNYGIKTINFSFGEGALPEEDYWKICKDNLKIEDQRKALMMKASSIEVLGYGQENPFD